MNLIRNSLVSSLGSLGLRRHGGVGFEMRCWKFFSISNSVQFLISKNSGLEGMGKRGGAKTRRHMDDLIYDMEGGSDDSVRGKDVRHHRDGRSNRSFAGGNSMMGEDNNVEDKEDLDRDLDDNEDLNFVDHAQDGSFAMKKNYGRGGEDLMGCRNEEELLREYSNDNYVGEIIRKSAEVPMKSPILRNVLNPTVLRDTFFSVSGVNTISCLINNGLQPLKLFYHDPLVFKYFMCTSRYTEYYMLCETAQRGFKGPSQLFLYGLFSKEEFRKICCLAKPVLPVTLIFHGSLHPKNLKLFWKMNYVIRAEKLISTCGAEAFYMNSVISKCLQVLFTLPFYENVKWSEIDEMIDSDCDVFFFSPDKKTPSLPDSDIFETNLSVKKKTFLVITENTVKEDGALLKYLKKWKGKRLIIREADLLPHVAAMIALWEIKKQSTSFVKAIEENN